MIYFDDIDYDVEISLYHKVHIGKKFRIEWNEEELEEDDYSDSSKRFIKVITELIEVG